MADAVLKKPGRLDDEEFEQMKQHTVIGSEIIKDLDMLRTGTIKNLSPDTEERE